MKKVVNMDEWHVGDPADWGDHVGVPDIPYMGYLNNEYDDNNGGNSNGHSEYQRYLRKAQECSSRGNHSQAIDYYEKARDGFNNKVVMILIAKEYEYMGKYEYALTYWKDLCNLFNSSPEVFEGHANLAYRMGKYEEAIASYRRELNIVENDSITSPLTISRLYSAMARAYDASGQSDIAESYRELVKLKNDAIVKDNMEQGDKYEEEGNYSAAKNCYKRVLDCEPDNPESRRKFDRVNRICNMDTETQNRFIKDSLERKERMTKKRELEAKKKEREEREEQEKRERELKENNPEYLKLEIQSRKEVFEISHLRLHLDYYQRKSNRAFEEIFRLEKLLEKCKDKENYPNDDINVYKKEIKHLEYCIANFKGEYTWYAKRLLRYYQDRLNELEKKNKVRIKII